MRKTRVKALRKRIKELIPGNERYYRLKSLLRQAKRLHTRHQPLVLEYIYQNRLIRRAI